MKNSFMGADILLPQFCDSREYEKWAVIACDQFTSEPEYWDSVEKTVGNNASALNITLPEIFLSQTDARISKIYENMRKYDAELLCEYKNSMIYVERTLATGKVRRGLVGAIDLEDYDYKAGTSPLIRATEGTVLSRIPPRVKIRSGAVIEAPHVMLLIDDPDRTVIEKQAQRSAGFETAYDFDLMLGGGHIKGMFLDRQGMDEVSNALCALASPEEMQKKYGLSDVSPLLFAVGDGNHSLASAKAFYEEIKAQIGEEAASSHPARYALVEVVNLHDESLEFEPIYRVLFNADAADVISRLTEYAASSNGSAPSQSVTCISGGKETEITFAKGTHTLTVGTLQGFLDAYISEHPEVEVDYIHGVSSTRNLAAKDGAVGFLFDGMGKNELFRSVIKDGALPRKTFSMGEAVDKRYYLECRRIVKR